MTAITYRVHESTDSASTIQVLFLETFTQSESESEGQLIGNLVQDILTSPPSSDDNSNDEEYLAYLAFAGDKKDGKTESRTLVGAIFLTKLVFAQAPTTTRVWLLAPVAIHPLYQRQGIGQGLIRYGLQHIQQQHLRNGDTTVIVMTYGDPAYYGKTGFRPVSAECVCPPVMPLSQPHGWQGQMLVDINKNKDQNTEKSLQIPGPSTCIAAFRNPVYW